MELRGSKRNDILFQKNGVAHDLYKNIQRIGDVDYNEALIYREWLINVKIPTLKNAIEDAIYDEFKYDEENFWKNIKKMDENFNKFEEAVRKGFSELEFLKSYA